MSQISAAEREWGRKKLDRNSNLGAIPSRVNRHHRRAAIAIARRAAKAKAKAKAKIAPPSSRLPSVPEIEVSDLAREVATTSKFKWSDIGVGEEDNWGMISNWSIKVMPLLQKNKKKYFKCE